MKKILLHSCCAPCTVYLNDWLGQNGFSLTSLFYNPNIRPQEEYQRRFLAMKDYQRLVGLDVIYLDNDLRTKVKDCSNCYQVRLRRTAQVAKDKGFDCFSTTLLISPYQKHDQLKELGEKISAEIKIDFYYNDFRPGFRPGQKKAKEFGLYRQKYCGCEPNS